MPGGVTQLLAKGVQDESLTDEPEITFFEAMYQQYVDFAIEAIKHTANGTPAFGRESLFELIRTGDMITRIVLEMQLPGVSVTGTSAAFAWAPYIGQTMLKWVKLEIGNTEVDKHYGLWMNIWGDLTIDASKHRGWLEMIGQQVPIETPTFGGGTITYTYNGLQWLTATHATQRLYVPLQFWFCRDPGVALPIVALPFAPVRIRIEFRALTDLYYVPSSDTTTYTTLTLGETELWADHIFVDNDERDEIVNEPHEYLVTQVQFPGEEVIAAGTATYKAKLNFNHPLKELMWFLQNDSQITTYNDWTDYTQGTGYQTAIESLKLTANNQDRFQTRYARVFTHVQPFFHHTSIPKLLGIFVYSFSLFPEEYQPNGTFNFSRIDNPNLELTFNTAITVASKLYIFAINVNLFRVANGTGGIGYTA